MPNVALIPPYAFLNDMHGRPLQMLLPSCLRSHAHIGYKQQLEGCKNSYLILDNGMFEEDGPLDTCDLLGLADEFRVHEIVMPDVPGDGFHTYEFIQRFLGEYKVWVPTDNEWTKPKLMAVVQGTSLHELHAFIDDIEGLVPEGTVLGFPRRLTVQGTRMRLEAMEYAVKMYGMKYPLHMLGLSREWPGEYLRAVRQFGSHLRGIDTDAAYVWAFNQGTLQGLWSANNERPKDYFLKAEDRFDRILVEYNIYVLAMWNKGTTPALFSEWRKVLDR